MRLPLQNSRYVWVATPDFQQTSIDINKLISRLTMFVKKYPNARVRTDGTDLMIHLDPGKGDEEAVIQFLMEG